MSVFGEFVASAPLSIGTLVVILRYGPTAVVTLIAGAVAALTRHAKRGERAVAVLHLLQSAREQKRDRRAAGPLRADR